MTTERSANINIGGDEYTLLLTTKATKDIAGRYGGLENLGDKLMKSENFEMAIGEIVWLITLLANQSILVHNLKNKDAPRNCSPKRWWNCSRLPWIWQPTRWLSPELCIRAPSAMSKAESDQKRGGRGDEELFTRLLYYSIAHLHLSQDEVWLMPFGCSGPLGVPQAI